MTGEGNQPEERSPVPSGPPRVTVVVPTYNESEIISSSLQSLLAFLRATTSDFELIVADDGSTDQTPSIVRSLSSAAPEVRLLTSNRNLGRGSALRLAFSQAAGMILAYVDADLPFDLSVLSTAILHIENGFDLAIASKYAPGAMVPAPLVRRMAGRTYSLLARTVLGFSFHDCQGGIKVMKRRVATSVLPYVYDNQWGWDTELVAKAWLQGFRIVEIPVSGGNHWRRKSRVKFVRDSGTLLMGLLRLRRDIGRPPP